MPDAVKQSRSYNSPRRREQAAATRRDILAAAQRLFERDGYAATTMAAIAAEAGVALKTVYVAFDNKAGVLRGLWNLLLRGDADDVPVAQRTWYRAVLDEPDPVRKLRLSARASRAVKERSGAVLEIIRAAAPVDPDIAALWGRIQSEFHANQRAIVQTLPKRALKKGLDVDRAADVMWTLNHPAVYALLAGERGWSADEYERWLGDAFCAQLLAKPAGGSR
jgi:AcrR family transcriptional regulator